MPEPARLYLVLYDVSQPRRWRRVYRLLTRHGAWTQLSAFFCRLTPARRDVLARDLAAALDPATDRLLIADLGDAERAAARLTALKGAGAARGAATGRRVSDDACFCLLCGAASARGGGARCVRTSQDEQVLASREGNLLG